MDVQYSPYALPLLGAAATTLSLGVFALSHRRARGSVEFALLMLALTVWSMAYAFWLMSRNEAAERLFGTLMFAGIASTPPLWLVAAVEYTGAGRHLTPSRLALLVPVPVITVLLRLTSQEGGLLFRHFEPVLDGGLLRADIVYGPWFWVHTAFSYALLLGGSALYARRALRSSSLHRGQMLVLLAGGALPLVGNVAHIFRLAGVPGVDATPFAFTVGGLLVASGLFRYRLFDLVPVAYDAVVREMADAVLVVDRRGRVAGANPAAEALLVEGEEIIGKPAVGALGFLQSEALAEGWLEGWLDAAGDLPSDLLLRDVRTQACFEARFSRLRNRSGGVDGGFLILHDVTERQKVEQRLRFLSLHDSLTGLYNRPRLESELERLQAEGRYPVAIFCVDVDGLKIVNDALGHRAGDDLLIACASVLRAAFPPGALIARVGGDEFAVAAVGLDPTAAGGALARLVRAAEQHSSEHCDTPLSFSTGYAVAQGPGEPLTSVFDAADRMMYSEKNGRTMRGGEGVIRSLLVALAAKDHGCDGHLSRVRALAVELGRAAGLGEAELEDLGLFAEVHDLGKLGVPDRILQKAGRLEPEELALMREHSVIGYRIARSAPQLLQIADRILHHHEWWNGGGYPTGLSGKEIPICCRIVAIVDAFDAMTSDRPYRRAVSREEALACLEEAAGSQFDPALVSLFVSSIRHACPAGVSAATIG